MEIEEQKRKAKANGDKAVYDSWEAGITKREYFAGLNMAACINNPDGNTLQAYNDYAIQVADDLLFQLAEDKNNE